MANENKDVLDNGAGEQPETQQTSEQNESGFKPITTQEELNRVISDRINRVKNQYSDYDDLKTKAGLYDSEKSVWESEKGELQAKLNNYENDSVKKELVREFGLTDGMEEFLTGSDKEAWRKQAEKLSKFVKPSYPQKSHTQATENGLARAIAKSLKS